MYSMLAHIPEMDEYGGDYLGPLSAHALDVPGLKEFHRTLTLSHPDLPLRFLVDGTRARTDYLAVDNVIGGELCSQRLLDVFCSASVDFIAYPAQVMDASSSAVLSDEYSLWSPPRLAGTIDWERSRLDMNPSSGQRYLIALALTAATEAAAPLLFRPAEKLIYLVHDHLRARVEAAGITGVEFLPLDVIGDPGTGRGKLELERRLRLEPGNAMLWAELGGLFWRMHFDAEALDAAGHAIDLRPDFARAWYLRGLILGTLQRTGEAAQALHEATHLDPSSSQAWVEYSAALCEDGRFREALASAEHALNDPGQAASAWRQIGVAHLGLGDFAQALAAFTRALQPSPGRRDPLWYLDQGNIYMQLGRAQDALDAYDRGLEYLPADRALWRQRAVALLALGHSEQAAIAGSKSQELDARYAANRQRTPQ